MTIATLTWVKSTEQGIPCAGASVTYAEMLNKMKGLIDASTYWDSTINLDAANNRGYLELRPKSLTAGITEGRCLYCVANAAVAAASGSERPLKANRLAPWSTADTTLTCKQWVAFSPNAATTGPNNDPWGTGTTYNGSGVFWSKLAALSAVVPGAGQFMWIHESAEVIAVCWTIAANQVAYFIFGKIVEAPDGNSVDWGLIAPSGAGETAAPGQCWVAAAPNTFSPPIGVASDQYSAASVIRAYGLMIKSDGTMYGFGRTQFDSLSVCGSGYGNPTDAVLQSIVLGGGTYFSGSLDILIGFLRQMRWGPMALRGQRLIDSLGVTQATYLNYHLSTNTRGGIWFHNSR